MATGKCDCCERHQEIFPEALPQLDLCEHCSPFDWDTGEVLNELCLCSAFLDDADFDKMLDFQATAAA